jgi:hypothetical protein
VASCAAVAASSVCLFAFTRVFLAVGGIGGLGSGSVYQYVPSSTA